MTLRIAIVGGGIGGLSLAAWLHRRGLSCTLFEAAPPSGGPAKDGDVHLSPLGRSLFEDLLGEPLSEAELAPVLPVTLLSHSGKPLMLMDDVQGPLAGLQRASHARLRERILAVLPVERVRFESRVVEVSQGGSQVLLGLEDGREETAELVALADGEDSSLRRLVWGDAPRPLELVSLQGLTAPGGSLPLGCVGAVRILGDGCTFHAAQREPLGPIAWTFSRRGSLAELAAQSAHAQRDEVAFLTSGWMPDVRPLLDATPDASMSTSELVSVDLPDRLSMGAITLLGDAAHAASPFLEHGAELALQEAMALATLLDRATPRTLPALLDRYDQEVRERARGDLNRALFNSKLFHLAGPFARFLRDSSLRLLDAGMQNTTREQLPPGTD